MTDGWDRLESTARSIGLTGGLEARVADPLWLLARQWQVGEFRGDDAAQPAGVRIRGRSVPLTTFQAPGDAGPATLPHDRPLETVAEATPEPDFGTAGLHASARAARRLIRLLRERGLGPGTDALRGEFPLAAPAAPVEIGEAGRAAADLLTARAIDAAALAAAPGNRVRTALERVLTEPKTGQAVGTVDEWRQWYRSRGGLTGNRTWDDERLEYSFTVGGRGPAGQLELQAPEDTGAQLDWYSFDMTSPGALDHGPGAGLPPRTITAVPAPVRYKGMPASRWWEFEDGQVHFGDVESGPADLARLLVAEFATSYARDWFVVPVTVPVGSLTELVTVEAFDTFGGRTIVPSTAMADQDRIDRTGGTRVWRLFELTGDEVSGGHPSPWLLVAPSAASSVAGPALERVAFIRDEAANLAWGIEQLVEGPLGQPLDRAEAWYTSRPPVPGTQPPAPASGAGDLWQYRLEATAPPWWVPLVPERVDPATSAEVRLRRARMQAWALLGAGQVGPKSDLLDPSRPRWLYEEEVPAGGAQVERRWQLARWHDGSVHLWLQRRKRPGRGGGTSGVRWDLLEQPGDPARPPDS